RDRPPHRRAVHVLDGAAQGLQLRGGGPADGDAEHRPRAGARPVPGCHARPRGVRRRGPGRGCLGQAVRRGGRDRAVVQLGPRRRPAAGRGMTTSLPFVSAVMAAYNYERYVGEALDSAVAQDYPADRLELIVIDDGSTDGTSEIARDYAERSG